MNSIDALREHSRSRSPPGNIKHYIDKKIDIVMGSQFYGFKLPSYHSTNAPSINLLKKAATLRSNDLIEKKHLAENMRNQHHQKFNEIYNYPKQDQESGQRRGNTIMDVLME